MENKSSQQAKQPQPAARTPERPVQGPAEPANANALLQGATASTTAQAGVIKFEDSKNTDLSFDVEWVPLQSASLPSGRFDITAQSGNTLDVLLEQGAYRKAFKGQGTVSTTIVPSAPIGTRGKLIVHDLTTGEMFEQSWTWAAAGSSLFAAKNRAGSLTQGLKKTQTRSDEKVAEKKVTAETTFFGIPATGRRFAFIIDISGSMSGRRIERCRTELAKALEQLPKSTEFIVLLFSNIVVEPPMQHDWIPVRQDTVHQMIMWFNGVGANGGTDAWPAFKRVFSFSAKPDAIFFLTDGDLTGVRPEDLTRLRTSPSGSVFSRLMGSLFSDQSSTIATVIHTIAVDESPSEKLLKQLAADSGGEYRLVSSSKEEEQK